MNPDYFPAFTLITRERKTMKNVQPPLLVCFLLSPAILTGFFITLMIRGYAAGAYMARQYI